MLLLSNKDYGFSHDIVMPSKVIWREKYQRLMDDRAIEWDKLIGVKAEEAGMTDAKLAKFIREKHHKVVRLGIPAAKRPKMWYVLCNARTEQERYPGQYHQVMAILDSLHEAAASEDPTPAPPMQSTLPPPPTSPPSTAPHHAAVLPPKPAPSFASTSSPRASMPIAAGMGAGSRRPVPSLPPPSPGGSPPTTSSKSLPSQQQPLSATLAARAPMNIPLPASLVGAASSPRGGGSSSGIAAPSSPHNVFRESVRYIEKDVDRTFANHPKFQAQQGVESLKKCLIAFSMMHPNIGYCQSLNFLAGILLLFMPEEDTYWMLHSMVELLLPKDYYSPGMLGVHTDTKVLKVLLAQHNPPVANHLNQLRVDVTICSLEWFLCLYVNTLPIETCLRVWDCLFTEGDVILFRVALALFKLYEKDILAITEMGPMFMYLQKMGQGLLDAETLVETVFSRPCHLKQPQIDKLRKQYQSQGP